NKEVRGVHDAAYLLAGFAIFSTLLALFRDKLLAHTFGAGIELDIYYAAFRTPDMIFAIVASMMSVFVLIPFLSTKDDDEQRHSLIHTLLLVFGILLITISAIMYVAIPNIIHNLFSELTTRGYDDELISLTRILLLQPVILGLSSIIASVMQYYGKYFIYAITAVFYNIGIITGIVFFVPIFGINGLGYGVVLGALLHLFIQLPTFFTLGFGKRFRFVESTEVLKVVFVSLPRTLALSANHITLFVLVAMAGKLPVGSIAVFTLAFNLQAAPLAIIGASYSTAAFPTLSRLFTIGESQKFVEQITSAARHIIFWSAPIIALVLVLRAQIVRVVYGSGSFDWSDTRLTAAAFAIFILSLVSQGMILLFIRGYYAASNTIKPLVFSISAACITVILATVFTNMHATMEPWRDFFEMFTRTTSAGSTAILMLPLAYSISSIITAVALVVSFTYDFRSKLGGLSRSVLESIVGAFFIGTATYLTLNVLSTIIITDTIIGIFLQGAISGVVGIVTGIMVLKLIGNREITTVWRILHHKFWNTKEIIAETEVT
ncbi:MAG: hypothetical protein LRZ97_01185, partial [Candidatus Pacebacteria bacterium]|nr:hypothetical protein [Candidatus Paceibacterota bacterium]